MVVDASLGVSDVSVASALDAGFSDLLGQDGPGKVVAATTASGAFVRVVCEQAPCAYTIQLVSDVVNASSGKSLEVEAGEVVRVLGDGHPARADVCLGESGAEVELGSQKYVIQGGEGAQPAQF